VIGVGSITNSGVLSTFSNRGPWVKCAAEGEDVVSTLFEFQGETEEPEPGTNLHPTKDFEDTDGWASWNGTSFSSPKVTAALATRKAEGATLDEAWCDLIAGRAIDPETGILLDGLAP
jgi:subtilisin family serine protease